MKRVERIFENHEKLRSSADELMLQINYLIHSWKLHFVIVPFWRRTKKDAPSGASSTLWFKRVILPLPEPATGAERRAGAIPYFLPRASRKTCGGETPLRFRRARIS